jgi:hypothetical protein
MGSPDQPAQTTTPILSPQQTELMNLAMPGIRSFAANVPQRYQGEQVAGFNPTQQTAQDMLTSGAVPAQSDLARSGQSVSDFYTGGNIWDPSVNANLRGAIDAAVRPITENYQQTVMPEIRSSAGAGPNFGGSRQGTAEGIASNAYMRNVGDTASKITQNEYETNVNAQLKALGLLPQTIQAQTAPGATEGAVGDVQQAQDQARINEQVANWNFDQYAPFLQSQELMSLFGALPQGGVTSTANTPQASPFMQALGGAGTGAAIGGAVGGPVGAGVGAVGGATLPFISRAFGYRA